MVRNDKCYLSMFMIKCNLSNADLDQKLAAVKWSVCRYSCSF